MKTSEIRGKNTDELRQELVELMRAQFGLRMQIATQQSNKTSELGRLRRSIARVRTVMREREAAEAK
jgi:large subunit ribosomal protein L29